MGRPEARSFWPGPLTDDYVPFGPGGYKGGEPETSTPTYHAIAEQSTNLRSVQHVEGEVRGCLPPDGEPCAGRSLRQGGA
jgi:hypothetical protein